MTLLPYAAAFAVTSGLAAWIATDRSPRALMWALRSLWDYLGAAAIFLAGNVGVGATIGYLGERAGWKGLSIYTITDWTVPVLSLFQAVVYCNWRGVSRQR